MAEEAPAVEPEAVVQAPVVEPEAVEPESEPEAVDKPVEEPVEEPEQVVARPAAARFRPTPAAEPEPADDTDLDTDLDTDPDDVPEQTIALETPTADIKVPDAAAADVATVPESRREKALARREAHEKSKAEKAALRARSRGQESQRGVAEKLVAKLPSMKPAVAAIFTGVVSGLICVGLTWGEVAGCEAIRGENNCNDGFGLLAVVVVLAIEIVIGANLLKAFKVSDPFSTSFLGVGLVAMVVMLTFMGDDKMISPLMIAVIPALTAAAFLLSWWVTVRFIEEPSESKP